MTDSDPKNLIVNYIPTPVTDAELRQIFEQFGEVESARIIVDRQTGHPKGYGFVKFKDEGSARTAIEVMNGFEIYNKRLKVTPARGPQAAQIGNSYQKIQQQQQQQPQQMPQIVIVQSPYHPFGNGVQLVTHGQLVGGPQLPMFQTFVPVATNEAIMSQTYHLSPPNSAVFSSIGQERTSGLN